MGKVLMKGSRVKKLLKLPIRFLVKARDFYVIGMSQLSDQMRYEAVSSLGCPIHIRTVPRSFSVGTTSSTKTGSQYSCELARAASVRRNKITLQDSSKKTSGITREVGKVPRSQSVGLGRIEEEEEKSECLSGEISFCTSSGFPRSKSCAVSGGGSVLYVGSSSDILKSAAMATA